MLIKAMNAEERIKALNEFSELNLEQLNKEFEQYLDEIERIQMNISIKMDKLSKLVKWHEAVLSSVEELKVEQEKLDVLTIRAKTQQKKFKRNVEKMESLNVSGVKVEVRQNDKIKLAEMKLKMDLMKHMLRTSFSGQDKGFSLNANDWQLQPFSINKNKPNSENRDVIWKSIGSCSRHNEDWEQIL